jgi:hypothetical protein
VSTDLARTNDEPRDVAVADPEQAAGALAHILGTGDLRQLSDKQRVGHYLDLCQSLGLNPRSRPFDWIEFYDPESGGKKLTLYANQSCASQLRRQHQISVRVVRREPVGSGDNAMFVVEVEGTTPTGRTGAAIKYVSLMGRQKGGGTYPLSGQQLANAYMKAETGALRRLTFSMVGMASPPDRDELSRARDVIVDGTGRIIDSPTPEQKALAADPRMAAAIGEPTFETVDAEGGSLDDLPDQRVKPEELERPKHEGPRPTFKASEEDVTRWLGAWFAAVKGLSLDSEEARHRFVAQWTADEWPKAKRTDSLRTAFRRMTAGEAGDFLAHVRALMDDERAELLRQTDEARGEETQPDSTKYLRDRAKQGKVADAVALTGGPEQPVAF